MTPEKLKEIEQLYLDNGDGLDASSYCVLDLIQEVRALRIDNSRSSQWSGSIRHANDLLSESQQRMSDRIKALEAEVEALRKDKERLEATCGHLCKLAADRYDRILELEHEIVNEQYSHSWTQAREEMAIRAARKGEPK